MDVVNVTSFTTATLDTGTWYMTIRALDRAGNWSASYATYGPFHLRPYYPPDIRPYPDSGWAEALVPSMNGDLTPFGCPNPPAHRQRGDDLLELCFQNIGELTAPSHWGSIIYLDGGVVFVPHAAFEPARRLLRQVEQPRPEHRARRPAHVLRLDRRR